MEENLQLSPDLVNLAFGVGSGTSSEPYFALDLGS